MWTPPHVFLGISSFEMPTNLPQIKPYKTIEPTSKKTRLNKPEHCVACSALSAVLRHVNIVISTTLRVKAVRIWYTVCASGALLRA